MTLIAFLVSALVTVGWLVQSEFLKHFGLATQAMKFNTSVGLVLSCVALFLLVTDPVPESLRRRLGNVLAIVVASIGFLTLLEILGLGFNIDTVLIPDNSLGPGMEPGRMTPITAFAMMWLGVALALLDKQNLWWLVVGGACFCLVMGVFGLLGHMMGARSVLGLTHYTMVSLSSSFCLTLVSASLLLVRGDREPMGTFLRASAGGVVLRRIVPFAILLPIIAASFVVFGERTGFFNPSFGAVAVGLLTAVLFVYVIWFTGERLDAFDAERRESRGLFQTVIDASPSLIYAKGLDGRFILVNSQFERVMGATKDQVIGKSDAEIFGEEYAHEVSTRDRTVIETGEARNFEEMGPDTENPRYYSSVRFPLRDASGRVYAVCGISTDITDTRHLENQLYQAQKLESVGQLAGGVAHDFNNMLTAITGHAEFIQSNPDATDAVRQDVGQVLAAANRAANLTRQLLTFARRQVQKPEIILLNEHVASVCAMLRRTIVESVDIVNQAESGLWLVRADPHLIEQVLVNLVVNARDAMPEGGKLTLQTKNVHLESDYIGEKVHIRPGDYVMLAVSDTGVGMDKATVDRMFEPFFTTKKSGTGLGLATSYGIVRQADGHIWVYSVQGVGTTVKVYLPRASEDQVPLAPMSQQIPRTGHETVLLAEDEDAVREIACRVLRNHGYHVVEASDGVEALRLADNDPNIDLLLTDMVMPNMGGAELANQLRQRMPSLRVLLTSGYADLAGVESTLPGEEMEFLQKPYTVNQLLQAVQTALESLT